jgi:hypothetical protein
MKYVYETRVRSAVTTEANAEYSAALIAITVRVTGKKCIFTIAFLFVTLLIEANSSLDLSNTKCTYLEHMSLLTILTTAF